MRLEPFDSDKSDTIFHVVLRWFCYGIEIIPATEFSDDLGWFSEVAITDEVMELPRSFLTS